MFKFIEILFFQRHDHLYSRTQLYVADRSEDRYLILRFKKYELFPEPPDPPSPQKNDLKN